MYQPKEAHLLVVHKIVQILNGKGILFKTNKNANLETYTDADYVGLVMNRRLITGYCTFFGVNLVTWKSKKQWQLDPLPMQIFEKWLKEYITVMTEDYTRSLKDKVERTYVVIYNETK